MKSLVNQSIGLNLVKLFCVCLLFSIVGKASDTAGIFNGWQTVGPSGGDVRADRAGALARLGEGAERVEVEGQLGVGRALGGSGQPIGGLGAEEPGVDGDGREFENYAVQHGCEVSSCAQRDAMGARRIDADQARCRTAFQIGQEVGIGADWIGMADLSADVPGPVSIGGPQGEIGRLDLIADVERDDRQSLDGGAVQAFEGLALEGLFHEGAPVGGGGLGEGGCVSHCAPIGPGDGRASRSRWVRILQFSPVSS